MAGRSLPGWFTPTSKRTHFPSALHVLHIAESAIDLGSHKTHGFAAMVIPLHPDPPPASGLASAHRPKAERREETVSKENAESTENIFYFPQSIL